MAKLRHALIHYGPLFSHGVMTGALIYFTFVSGPANG
jgi:hypothetical protein